MIRFGNGGSVVLIASMSATIANKGVPMTAYNTSKGAVAQMARNLASEWGKYGIRGEHLSRADRFCNVDLIPLCSQQSFSRIHLDRHGQDSA